MMYGVQQWILFLAGVLVILVNVMFVQGCPPQCSCEDYSGTVTVKCINGSLTSVPMGIPGNTNILNLHGNKITDLKYGLDHLVHLKMLDLSSNQISAINLPTGLNISTLYLQNNRISMLHQRAFENITNLNELNLANNGLTHIEHNSFTGIQNLKHLNLSYNNISFLDGITDLEMINSLDLTQSLSSILEINLTLFSDVEELILKENEIKVLNWTAFHGLDKLKFLDLSNNLIPYIDSESFPILPGLIKLQLNGNQITYITNDALESVSTLKTLTLDRNKLTEINDQAFHSLSKLTDLSISQMDNLVYLSKDVFSGLKTLQTLTMCQNPKLSFIHIHLFSELDHLNYLNLSFNNISNIPPATFPDLRNLSVDLRGNTFICDCGLDWLVKNIQSNDTNPNILYKDQLMCSSSNSNNEYQLIKQDREELHCDLFNVSTNSSYVTARIGSSVRLTCDIQGLSSAKITWITSRNRHLTFHNYHHLILRGIPSLADVDLQNGSFHKDHEWHSSDSYYSELESWRERMVVLQDGSLYIDYVLRMDSGPYTCKVEDPLGNVSSLEITLRLDQDILPEVKIMSVLVGLGCSASFFMLNLIHVVITYLAVRCINQRRREAILQIIENLDNYRSTQLGRLKENYNSQLAKIRDTYHNRVAKLRENYVHQRARFRSGASHIREGASHKVDTIKDNYNYQLGKLRDYSSHQVEQLRDRYNNQLVKIREYGSMQLGRAREKYKLQQQHVLKILETMNLDNCRTVFDTECVRTESMLFVDDFNVETGVTNFPSPTDSASISEYETASSNNSSKNASLEIINMVHLSNENQDIHDACAIISQENLTNEIIGGNEAQKGENNGETTSVFVEIRMMDDSSDSEKEMSNLCIQNGSTDETTV